MVEVRVKDPFGTFVDFKDGNGIDFGPSHGPMNFIPGGTLYSFSLLIDPTMSGIFEIEFVMSMSDPGASIKIQPPPIVSELQSSSQLVCESLDYRFGFNGMEKDNEAKGQGNSYDFGARIYDSRLGRWMSADPFFNKTPDWSPYRGMLDNPLLFVDPGGKTEYIVTITINALTGETAIEITTTAKIMTDGMRHARTTWLAGSEYYVNEYYDYANVTIKTVNPETGVTTTTTGTIIFNETESKDETIVLKDGEKCGTTLKEEFKKEDHGIQVNFGIGMSGSGDGPLHQDFAKHILGHINFNDLNLALKRSSLSTGWNPGKGTWRKMESGKVKEWINNLNAARKTGEKIGKAFTLLEEEGWKNGSSKVLVPVKVNNHNYGNISLKTVYVNNQDLKSFLKNNPGATVVRDAQIEQNKPNENK